MKHYLARVVVVCSLMAVAIFSPSTAKANELKFTAILSPANEVPAVMTEGSATGTVTVTLDVTSR